MTRASDRRELWEQAALGWIKGGDAYRKRRKTKGQLVREFYGKEGKVSPEIGTEVREGADDVKLNIPYEIVNVETDVMTDVQSFRGVRVELLSAKAQVGNVMLWKRPVTGTGSKLGRFITLLGSNTDKWLHKWIIFRGWDKGNRVIELAARPDEVVTKVTITKGVTKAAKAAQAKK